MKQVLSRKGKILVVEAPAPKVKEGDVLVSNVYSLISVGTEVSGLERASMSILSKLTKKPEMIAKVAEEVKARGLRTTINLIKEKLDALGVLGYSSAGWVVGKGENVDSISIKERIACAGYAHHAEIVCVPKNLTARIPENVGFKEAAFTALGAIALQSVRRAKPELGETIVVLGLGLVGQLVVQLLRVAGCKVVGIDLNPKRVDVAEKLGLDKGMVGDENIVERVLNYTNGVGADVVVICAATSSNQPVNQAMQISRKKGRVVVVGDVGLSIDRRPFYEKELNLLISTSYGPGRYDPQYEEKGIDYPIGYVRWTEQRNMEQFLRLVAEKKVKIEPLITHEFALEDAPKAYRVIQNPEVATLGVLLRYKSVKEKKKIERKVFVTKKSERKGVNVALIGCGAFAKGVHLPNLSRISGYNLRAVVSRIGTNAKQVAKQYGAEYCTTDLNDVLKDENINLVFITTRHNLHAPFSIAAAKAGKDIFVEKPMGMRYEECKEVLRAVEKNKVLYTIGFNRRFSLFAVKAKQILKKIQPPFIINYRVNAKRLPLEHWAHDPIEGGGRMLGEACHFFDFVYWLIESEPLEIFTKSISPASKETFEDENSITTVKFVDGSTACLTYSSLGHPSFSKERLEIFGGGNVIVIDGFKKLLSKGQEKVDLKLRRADKGHYNELVELLKAIRGECRLGVTVQDAWRATVCSLKALKSLRTGRAEKIS